MKKISKNKNSLSVYLIFSVVFFILLCLGMWQLNKHHAKNYKKTLINTNLNKGHKNLDNFNLNINDLEVIKIKGEILENKALFFEPRTYKGKVGYHKLIPIKVKEQYVLVNRGFTTQKKKESLHKIKIENIQGIIINFPKPKFFELKNDIKGNKWYTLKIEDISKYLNIKLVPFLIYEINNSSDQLINVKPNYLSEINHLNYAVTWFMLAVVLSFIFIVFIRKLKHV